MSDRPDAGRIAIDDHLVELDEAECLRLLARRSVGRMALTSGALPIVLPLNYVVHGRSLVMATDPGLKLRSARAGDVVCVEVDDWDEHDHVGWYVAATGQLTEITDVEEVGMLGSPPLGPSRHVHDPHHIRLAVELLVGRRSGEAPVS
jgi:hypothetical protein